MKLTFVLIGLMVVMIGVDSAGADDRESSNLRTEGAAVPDAGVPLALARERAGAITDVRYELVVTIVPDGNIICVGKVSLNLADIRAPLVLDFAGEDISPFVSNGDTVQVIYKNEHVIVPPEHLKPGENEFTIQCRSSTAPLHWEKDHLYSLFVPARAREVFPCFDQPDMKARFSLSIVVPDGWTAVSNAAARSRAPAESARENGGGPRSSGEPKGGRESGGEPGDDRESGVDHEPDAGHEIIFEETAPLATYHFAFAAGEFRTVTAERGGRVMTLYHLEPDSAKVARNVDAIFDLHAEAIRWMEEYTGIQYPFEKFDFVTLPVFPYSGMEHPGAIFYRAERLFLDESATEMDRLRRASVISHETAHMWFGDLVTMTWFDDVWLKEAFAQFMADRIVQPAFPGVDHRLLFAASHFDPLYAVERSAGTHPIRQRLDNLDEAGSLYGNIIYHKPPLMLNQLEVLVGEKTLRDGLRRYLETYRFANASWEDLIAILDPLTDRDLGAWSGAWVMERGRPVISIELVADGCVTDDGGGQGDAVERAAAGVCRRLRVTQDDPLGRGLVWPQRFSLFVADCSGDGDGPSVAVGTDRSGTSGTAVVEARSRVLACELSGRAVTLQLDDPITENDFILPCAAGAGFGLFALDEESKRLLRRTPPRFTEPLHRGVYAIVLHDNVLAGNNDDVALYLDILMSELARETVEVNLQTLLDYLVEAFWCFLPENHQRKRAGDIEELILEKMASAPEASMKSACFKAFRSVALTDAGVQFLRDVWEKKRDIEGLRLSERDYAALACELAVRGVTGWRGILDEQEGRFEDEELRRRFQFVRRAASADPSERDSLFAGLANVENRRREPWVLEALSYLHHPLRARESERYLRSSLELLEEIRATGDIFFPRDWIETTLRYHSSNAAVSTVRVFLEARPDYPERLRLVVLQAADLPSRANRLRKEIR